MGNSIKSALHTNLRDIHIAHKQQFTCISYPHLQYIILKRFAVLLLKKRQNAAGFMAAREDISFRSICRV